jgi:hypothetical protein
MTPLTERKVAADALGVPRHDWSARVRSSALDALRYTKFVGVMKRALQLAAFAVIAAVLAFFFFQRQPARITMGFEHLGRLQNDLAMVKPRLSGQDGEGNPFVITADAAIQDAKNPKRARLTKVEADLSLDRGSWLNANVMSCIPPAPRWTSTRAWCMAARKSLARARWEACALTSFKLTATAGCSP